MRFRFFIYLIFLFSFTFSAYLRDVPQKITQPDGTVIDCFSSGDEFYNWVHDERGYTIVRSQLDGYCYYANEDLSPSAYKVGEIDPEMLGIREWIKLPKEDYLAIREEYLENDIRRTPTTGTVNNLNVFIRFADENEFLGSFTYYDRPFNLEEGPSMRHYFQEVSYNTLDAPTTHFPIPDGDIVISYQDEYPRNYYEPYNAQTNPDGYTNDRTEREHTLLRKAIEFIRSEVPVDLNIDGDNDGRVDNVTFLVYGSPGAWADLLWPHRWSLYSQYVTIHGKQVWDYNFNMETGGYFTVGTLAHEFNHSLSAPDLYHYNETGAPVACGGWDVMDGSNDPPQYMGAFMKAKYGHWIQDTNGDGQKNEYDIPLLDSPGTYELNPLHDSTNYAYRIKSPYTDNQYFVVEYRYKQGLYDNNTPGNDNGLLVYRINTCCGGNAQGPPDEVYIYRPNGDADTNGNLGSAIFSAEVGRDKINDQTNPSAFLYPGNLGNGNSCDNSNGCDGGLYIKDIGVPGETITFKYMPIFLNTDLRYMSDDSDGDGVLNPGEQATLNFSVDNTSLDAFAYALTLSLSSNEYFDVLSEDVFIEELGAGDSSSIFSFDIKVNDGVAIGEYVISMDISGTVYQENFGEFEYSDTIDYEISVSINQKNFPYETSDQVFCSPAIFDLDQDGDKEIIFGDNSGIFHILNQNMTPYNTYNIGDEIWGAPAIDDLDGDGDYEIAISSKNGFFYIFDHLGELVYEYDTERYLMAAPSISSDKSIWVPSFHNDGELFEFVNTEGGWELSRSVNYGDKIQKGAALHDLDGNGIDDIVVGTDGDEIKVSFFDEDGIASTDDYQIGGKIRSAPAIIEFRDNEFLVVAGSKDNSLYAINPITRQTQFIYETGGDVESPSFFEHRENGTVIVFGSSDGFLYMVDTNGNDVPGWPKDLGGPVKGSPAISDIDADGLTDIAIGQAEGKIYVFDENGNLLNNFPLTIEFPFTSSPCINDLDGDGDLEIIIGASTGLHGYDYKVENGTHIDYWSMYRGDYRRTGYFESISYLDANLLELPNSFSIKSAFPNPFNPIVNINIDIPDNTEFSLAVYNLKGALVSNVYTGTKLAGNYTFNWDGSNHASGAYFVKLSYKESYKSHKIMLIK